MLRAKGNKDKRAEENEGKGQEKNRKGQRMKKKTSHLLLLKGNIPYQFKEQEKNLTKLGDGPSCLFSLG